MSNFVFSSRDKCGYPSDFGTGMPTISADRNQRIAETLQHSMLQVLPTGKFPGLEVETFYEAAMHESDVGGDFFDAFALSERKFALVVGDVMGKGLIAATRTTEVKYALRAFLHEYQAPEIALAHLNNFICKTHRLDDDSTETFIVLALAVVDTAKGLVTLSSAGAEPTLLLRWDGTAEPVTLTGLPLGVQLGASYSVQSRLLSIGETVLMATDGITEARRSRAFLGTEGFAALAEKAGPTASLRTLKETICAGARAFAGGVMHDDACLLLARHCG